MFYYFLYYFTSFAIAICAPLAYARCAIDQRGVRQGFLFWHLLCISDFCLRIMSFVVIIITFVVRILTFVVITKAKAQANAIVKIRTTGKRALVELRR